MTELRRAFAASKFNSSRVVCRLVDRARRFPSCADSKCPRLAALDSLCAQIPVTSFKDVAIKQIGRLLSRMCSSPARFGSSLTTAPSHSGGARLPVTISDTAWYNADCISEGTSFHRSYGTPPTPSISSPAARPVGFWRRYVSKSAIVRGVVRIGVLGSNPFAVTYRGQVDLWFMALVAKKFPGEEISGEDLSGRLPAEHCQTTQRLLRTHRSSRKFVSSDRFKCGINSSVTLGEARVVDAISWPK
jgi:hypothetical protein